eukprot:Seg5464.1 transcript_id=Seg5464.1/GoldUCD/mRNA.D3Y31 product="MAM and LDL-receptor class A domain-containing protein 2" protein_id=Seg5464.1/GoldUCD/D3Y31
MNRIIFIFLFQWFTSLAIAQRCFDTHGNCYYWYLSSYCSNPRTRPQMQVVCRKTCEFCHLPVRSGTRNIVIAVCRDNDNNCGYYANNGYCQTYPDWMKQNCQLSCNLCPTAPPTTPPVQGCKDLNTNCPTWKKYCIATSIYWPYMSKNCKKTCDICTDGGTGGGGGTGTGSGKKQFTCDFENGFCDWANQPIDDAADWAVGVVSGGPSAGANGSAKYAYVDSTNNGYAARLFVPWELILPVEKSYIGSMCMHFRYQTGSGSLKIIEVVYPTATNKRPSSVNRGTFQGSGTWVSGRVLVQVDDKRQLVLEGVVGSSGRVVVDNISFVKGRC